MGFAIIFWSILVGLLLSLSLPPALIKKSWKWFFAALALSAAGILLPLFIFGMSFFLVPDWKGGCEHGWLDCFHLGKLALTPLVLWACAAFYVVQILKPAGKPRIWVDLGLFVGALVSTLCLVVGLIVHGVHDRICWWLLVPFCVSIWFSLLCARAMKAAQSAPMTYIITALGMLPFWALSIFWSKQHYRSLPDSPPGCFVVTAALRGHEQLVGPFTMTERHGGSRRVNRQLLIFWHFEEVWQRRSPNSHRAFRRGYNRLGPRLARRVQSPYAADLVYLLLKPFEAIASLVVAIHTLREDRHSSGRCADAGTVLST